MNKLEQLLEYSFSGWKQFGIVVGTIFVCSFVFSMVVTNPFQFGNPHKINAKVENNGSHSSYEKLRNKQSDNEYIVAEHTTASVNRKIIDNAVEPVDQSARFLKGREKKQNLSNDIEETENVSGPLGLDEYSLHINSRSSKEYDKQGDHEGKVVNAFAGANNSRKSHSGSSSVKTFNQFDTSSLVNTNRSASLNTSADEIVEQANSNNNEITYAQAMEATGRLREMRNRMCINAKRYNNAEQLELGKAALLEAGCNI